MKSATKGMEKRESTHIESEREGYSQFGRKILSYSVKGMCVRERKSERVRE